MAGLLSGLKTPAPKVGGQTKPQPIRMPGEMSTPKPAGGKARGEGGGGLLSGLRGDTAPPPAAATPNVTPQKQAQYDTFVKNGYKLIYNDQSFPAVLDRLKGGQPVEALANTAATVVFGLEQSAKEKGVQLDGDVMMHGGAELLGDLANLSKEAGGHQFSQEEVESAFFHALDLYKLLKDGTGGMDPAPFKQDLARLEQMDQAGQLASAMPDTVKRFDPEAAAPARGGR